VLSRSASPNLLDIKTYFNIDNTDVHAYKWFNISKCFLHPVRAMLDV